MDALNKQRESEFGKKKIFFVDAYALIFRFYYAFMRSPMRSPSGENVSTVFGFVKYINDLIDREKPDLLGVAFDVKGGTFRNELYPPYKANREATPDDIIKCTPIIKRFLEAKNIPILEVCGYEADDVIGTMSVKAKDAGYDVYMVTPDKDFGQLVQENVSIYKPAKGENGVEIVRPEDVCQHYGISDPKNVIDILAIWGDASDNIPGIRGIGEKGASKLVGEFGSVENILKNIDLLSQKQRDAFIEGGEQVILSKTLATICLDVPIEFHEENLHIGGEDSAALGELYLELGFRNFLAGLQGKAVAPINSISSANNSKRTSHDSTVFNIVVHQPNGAIQQSLFDFDSSQDDKPEEGARIASLEKPQVDSSFLPIESKSAEDRSSVKSQSSAGGLTPNDNVEIASYKNAENTPHTYIEVDNNTTMDVLVGEIARSRMFCFDTETTSVEPVRADLVGVSICVNPHKAYWFRHDNPYLKQLKSYFEDPSIDKIGQNIKYDIIVLRGFGFEVRGKLWDTMIMHYLLDPEGRHSMDFMARQLLEYDPIPIERLIGKGAKQVSMIDADSTLVAEYAAEDADVTMQLFEYLLPKLRGQQKEKLYDLLEEPLIRVLVEMEMRGVAIDANMLHQIGKELAIKESEIVAKVNQIAGVEGFNLNSPKQLGTLLFEQLGIGGGKKTKLGAYKTDEQTLQELSDKHEIIPMVLEYRGIKKLLTTYVDVLPTLVNEKTGRIHTSFNQAVTATGRLSSSNPNLQNIPIRTDVGREIRRAFVSGVKGWKIVAADYSQVELRIMAHLSGDKNLIEAFECGEDVHTATASKIYGVPLNAVTKDQRRHAKMANFGIIYGVSATGLGQRLQIPPSEARKLISNYFTHYPEVKKYMENVAATARQDGFVQTIFGRQRILDGINADNSIVRSFAERNAVNAPIQGSAADIMKLAMIGVENAMQEGGFEAKMLLQVHDELVIEAPEHEVEKVSKLLVEQMQNAAKLAVKLEVEVGVGDNWLEAH